MAEEPHHRGDGNQGKEEAGEDELVDHPAIAAGSLNHDRHGADGRDGTLEDEQQSDIVTRPNQNDKTQGNQGKENIFDQEEFDDFRDEKLTFVFEVGVDGAANDKHEQGDSHITDHCEGLKNETGHAVVQAKQAQGRGQQCGGKDGIDDPGPLNALPGLPKKEGVG